MATIFPEIVLSSLRPLGEEVKHQPPAHLQDLVTGLGKVVELLRAFWGLQREKLRGGIEVKGFLHTLALFRQCAEETIVILDALRPMAPLHAPAIADARSQAERVGQEAGELLARLGRAAAPPALPLEVRQAVEQAVEANSERGDDIIARLQRGEDL